MSLLLTMPLWRTYEQEITFRRLACDEDGRGLVWTGETQAITPSGGTVPRPSAAATSPAAPTSPPGIAPMVPSLRPCAIAQPDNTVRGHSHGCRVRRHGHGLGAYTQCP